MSDDKKPPFRLPTSNASPDDLPLDKIQAMAEKALLEGLSEADREVYELIKAEEAAAPAPAPTPAEAAPADVDEESDPS